MRPKHESLIADDLFYVFVDVGREPSDLATCYILPSRVVADAIRLCHKVWLATPGRNGQPHRDSAVRRLLPDYSGTRPETDKGKAIIDRYSLGWLDQYRENWSILGLPENDSF